MTMNTNFGYGMSKINKNKNDAKRQRAAAHNGWKQLKFKSDIQIAVSTKHATQRIARWQHHSDFGSNSTVIAT